MIFRKKKILTGVFILMMSTFLMLESHLMAASTFTDLQASHWAYDSVKFLAEKGIISGMPDGSFNGNSAMTRYQSSVAMKRVIDYVQGNSDNSLGSASVSDERVEALEKLVRSALMAIESAGRDYREIKQKMDGYSVGTDVQSGDISVEFELNRIDDSVKALEKKTEKNETAISEINVEIETLKSNMAEEDYRLSGNQKEILNRFDAVESQINVLRWTAVGGVVVGIAGVVIASFAYTK